MTKYQAIVEDLANEFVRMTVDPNRKTVGPFSTFSAIMAQKELKITDYCVDVGTEHGLPSTTDDLVNTQLGAFRMSEDSADQLVAYARQDADVFDLAMTIVQSNIFTNQPLPLSLRTFAISVLNGQWRRPSPPHRSRHYDFMLIGTIFHLLTVAIQIHGLKMSRNDESPALSACDAVSEALQQCGQDFTFSQLKELCISKRKSSIRSAVLYFLLKEHGPKAIFLGGKVEDRLKIPWVAEE